MKVNNHGEPLDSGTAHRLSILTVPLMLSLASAGLADDTRSPCVPLPGLESEPFGSAVTRAAAVTLRDGQVTLNLAVGATADAAMLVLNGPQFGWLGAAERYPDRQFPELKIRLNGADVTPQDRFEAMAGKNNVTNLLRAADMDPWAITRNPSVTTAHPRNPQVLKTLRNAGAIADAGPAADAAPTADAAPLFTAKWLARRVVAIPLTPGADATLQLEYTARPGLAALTAESSAVSSLERRYCLSEKDLQRLRSSASKSPVSIKEYDIAVGVDGKAPSTVAFSWHGQEATRQARPSLAYWCGPGGKSILKRGIANRERAATDESGVLHVLVTAR